MINSSLKTLIEDWLNSKPLFKTFRTDRNGYIYDTGTNKILSCTDLEYDFLDNLSQFGVRQGLKRIEKSYTSQDIESVLKSLAHEIETKHILSTKRAQEFGLSYHFKDYSYLLDSALSMIQIEITEECNLRCDYCIYNSYNKEKRDHGIKHMSQETAFRAIDYISNCGKSNEEVAIAFYGGEPLIRFPLIQDCVNYAHQVLKDRKHRFSLTTNGTLLTPFIAKYFAQENFAIHVSLDGPHDIHDQYRKDKKGKGSFRDTVEGLKNLFDAYNRNSKSISLSMVYTPPYSKRRLDRIAELWEELPWLPKDIAINISYAQYFTPSFSTDDSTDRRDFSLFEWAKERYIADLGNNNMPHPLTTLLQRKLASLIQRPIYSQPTNKYHLNGCCIPGVRKLFVSASGDFHLCERIGRAPSIGDVFSGCDRKTIESVYIAEYAERSLPYCADCWALRLCGICYIHAFRAGRINLPVKKGYCDGERWFIQECLKLLCYLIETNKKGLEYLQEWEIR